MPWLSQGIYSGLNDASLEKMPSREQQITTEDGGMLMSKSMLEVANEMICFQCIKKLTMYNSLHNFNHN